MVEVGDEAGDSRLVYHLQRYRTYYSILLSVKQSCQVVIGWRGAYCGNRLMLARAFDTVVGLGFRRVNRQSELN